jgi:hypothetical protein
LTGIVPRFTTRAPTPSMPRASRDKGLRGEHEVAAIFRAHGFEVRGLEGAGDHLCIMAPGDHLCIMAPREQWEPGKPYGAHLDGLTIHSEVKRQERLQLWQWLAQLEAEAPPGTLPLLSFRRNRSPWYACVPLEALVKVLA